MSANRQYQETKEKLKIAQKHLTYKDNLELDHIIEQFIYRKAQSMKDRSNNLTK